MSFLPTTVPEGVGRVNGVLPFDRAKVAGREQLGADQPLAEGRAPAVARLPGSEHLADLPSGREPAGDHQVSEEEVFGAAHPTSLDDGPAGGTGLKVGLDSRGESGQK